MSHFTTYKISLFSADTSNNPHHPCLISYWINARITPSLSSHGNAKVHKPFHPTWPSTLKKECPTRGPKATVERVSSAVAGVMSAAAPGQLPQDENQVSCLRKGKMKDAGPSQNAAADDLFVMMQRAHTEDPASKVLCDIKTAPEPAIMLAVDQQLHDLVHFSTSTSEFCIITIDPTFTLGDFDVTPITYRHLLLETKWNKQPSIFLGPVLLHYKKTFAPFLHHH